MKVVENKVAFITGGSSGIGQGILRVLADAGMKLAFSYRNEVHLEETMRYLRGKVHILPIRLDVTDRTAMNRAADRIEGTFGNVDLLVNNAGVNLFAPMDEATYDDWDWLIDVNLKGIINSLVTFLPRMKSARNGGHIVNTGSMGSFISGPNVGIYTTTKFAVRGLTECLRYSLAEHGIGVSLLCPGLVVSNICGSDESRPVKYSKRGSVIDKENIERVRRLQSWGMDPLVVGKMTLEGIVRNDPYIFTHPDHKEELKDIFDEIISLIPDGHPDEKRHEIEEQRRGRIKAIKARIQEMPH